MQAFCGFILVLMAFLLGGVMLWQARRGTVDLLSVRNFLLLGFILFQLISGAFTLWTGEYGDVSVTDQPRVTLVYTAAAVVFPLLLLWFYKWRWPAGMVASRLASDVSSPPWASMIVLAYAFLGLGMVVKFVLVYVQFIGPFFDAAGTGLILVSVSMAAWVWAPRLWNPAVAIAVAPIAAVALFAVLTGGFGRRDIVGFVGAAAWGAFHGHWKHLPARVALPGLAVVGVLGLMLFGAFTATRRADDFARTPGEIVARLGSRNPLQGLTELTTGQMAAANSMYLIQSRPRDVPYDTLHTARYTIVHVVPRRLWPDKPDALGKKLPREIQLQYAPKNLTLGAGLIGHIWNDNPWLAFILYALVLAMTVRIFDELIRRSPHNPFVVLPMAVGIGELVALPRGESGLFFVRAIAYTLGAWLAMAVIARLFLSLGWIRPNAGWTEEPAEAGGAPGDSTEAGPWDGASDASPEPGAWDTEAAPR